MQHFTKLMKLFPRHCLSCMFLNRDTEIEGGSNPRDQEGGQYAVALDLTGLYVKDFVNNPHAMATWCVAACHLLAALNPDLGGIRQGVHVFAECEGFDWKRNFDINIKRKLWADLVTVHPFNINRVKHFRTGVFINLILSMAKRFVPPEVCEAF